MIFTSLTYILFIIIFLTGYWIIFKKKNYFIFISSLIFYSCWKIEFAFLILLLITINYYSAKWIYSAILESKKKIILLFSVSLNIFYLIFFKYYYFISENINFLARLFGLDFNFQVLNILLPIGISFYTFQSISYIFDVYKNKTKVQKNFILFANYILFFPQLIAGPILRANELILQLSQNPSFKFLNFYSGVKRIIFGFFLKLVIADNLSTFVEQSFSIDVGYLSGIDVLTISYLFGFQIYFDFSAYSHIAIGSALLCGIKFPENFNFPYHSISPKEFWSRWHITLSKWVRDYLYLPLVANGNSKFLIGELGETNNKINLTYKFIIALVLTWSIMGLWHGAEWKYVIWGLIQALIIIFFRFINKIKIFKQKKIFNFTSWLITLQLVMISWIPFRANNISDTIRMFNKLFDLSSWFNLSLKENTYLVIFIVTSGYFIMPFFLKFINKFIKKNCIKWTLEVATLFLLITTILVFFNKVNEFIYFQF